ncbi:hypothetical protein EJ04DRAFT_148744 [Polyplosphaeria fusca]|uniref:Uncharacterized protein n=1 Tax=Polyplosphaeria fusca TaxID=682080 RepID=A0A9P4UUF2_9PLEO|nr:hypothetical protein EJ04DRAFT_148744 [Polyplosphaeria fusca]
MRPEPRSTAGKRRAELEDLAPKKNLDDRSPRTRCQVDLSCCCRTLQSMSQFLRISGYLRRPWYSRTLKLNPPKNQARIQFSLRTEIPSLNLSLRTELRTDLPALHPGLSIDLNLNFNQVEGYASATAILRLYSLKIRLLAHL